MPLVVRSIEYASLFHLPSSTNTTSKLRIATNTISCKHITSRNRITSTIRCQRERRLAKVAHEHRMHNGGIVHRLYRRRGDFDEFGHRNDFGGWHGFDLISGSEDMLGGLRFDLGVIAGLLLVERVWAVLELDLGMLVLEDP